MSAARASLRADAAVHALALAGATGVKAFFSGAGADALSWILAPTAALVGALSGERFEAEPGVGYLSRELALSIAPACAGLNFLVIAFCTLVFGFTRRIERPARRFGWLLAAAALAYMATLLANAVRIALAIVLREAALPDWLSASQAHRLEGVVVYLGSLWLLSFGVSRAFAGGVDVRRAALLPLLLYLGITLLVPLANGAQARPGFWTHGCAVLLASLGLTLTLYAGLAAARVLRR